MKSITIEEYNDAKKIVEQYEDQLKCKHLNTEHILDYNSYPYGVDYEYDKCKNCGEMINLKQI